jgi:hypothetical protein
MTEEKARLRNTGPVKAGAMHIIADASLGMFLIGLAAGATICGAIGYSVSVGDNRPTGFLLGFLLGPLGIIIAAIIGNREPKQRSAYHDGGVHISHSSYRPPVGNRHVEQRMRASAVPSPELPPQVPDDVTVNRDGAIIGTWRYADVLEYLADGRLLPTDSWHDPMSGRWHPLGRLLNP